MTGWCSGTSTTSPSRSNTRSGRRLINGIIRPHTSTLRRDSSRARDLFESDRRVIRAFKPVKAEVATGFESRWEGVAGAAGADTTVLLAPALGGRAPFVGAAVELAYSSTWNLGLLVFETNI